MEQNIKIVYDRRTKKFQVEIDDKIMFFTGAYSVYQICQLLQSAVLEGVKHD
jgi:hypothetical protein